MRGAHSCGAARHPQHLAGTARPWGRLVPGAGVGSQEPVEQLPAEAQADGGVVDVEGEVLLGLEVQVGQCQLQVCHPDPAGTGWRSLDGQTDSGSPRHRQHSLADVVVERPLLPMQVRHGDVLQLLLHEAQPLLLHCRAKRAWAGHRRLGRPQQRRPHQISAPSGRPRCRQGRQGPHRLPPHRLPSPAQTQKRCPTSLSRSPYPAPAPQT